MADHCPICASEMRHDPRYPRAVCRSCASRVTDAAGRPLELFNVSPTGAYGASYKDTGEDYPSHDCYIDGIQCRADEAHLGGIVVQTT
jgi:hypothetical protein